MADAVPGAARPDAVGTASPQSPEALPAASRPDAYAALAALFADQYLALVRLAFLLVCDLSTAERVVQDAFVAVYDDWYRLRNVDSAVVYLKHAVVQRSRTTLRHRGLGKENMSRHPTDMPSVELGAMTECRAVLPALRELPARQREVLVLSYYADLSAGQIAGLLGIAKSAVERHLRCGMAKLRTALEWQA